jgi:hypothetical protein
MKGTTLTLFGLLAAALFAMLSCGNPSSSTSLPVTTSTTTTTTTATCNQNCQDNNTSSAAISLVTFLYNQNFAGSPVGSKNTTVTCPQGGAVQITGTTAISTSTNINTLHLTYSMTSCGYQTANYNLTFTGTIKEDGTFESLPGTFIAMTYASPTGGTLNYSGTVSSAAPTQVSGNCAASLSRNQAGSASETINGTLCGRSVSF